MANSKTLLKTYCQECHLQLPVYSTEKGVGSSGFTSSVRVCERNYESQAIHPSAQLAEEDAARVAYKNLKQSVTDRISKPAPEVYSRSTGYGYESLGAASRATLTPAVASRSCSAQSACTGTGLATNGKNTNATADYSQKLEKLCNAHGLPTPQYVVKESPDAAGSFAATVVVGKGEYLSGTSDSYVEAKEYAALVALAEVGLNLLNINEKEDAITSNYKGVLQEFLAKRGLGNPTYSTVQSRLFVSTVSLKDLSGKPMQLQGKGYFTKKDAEQSAAKQACIYYELVN